MKRILVIAALLGVMFTLDALRADRASHPATLAAIGFVVLASFATAELGSALSLPRVTGYILAGAALGPSLGNILSGQVVTEMRMFNTLALGLIATSAGLELDLRQLLKLGKTLSATILIKVIFGVVLVGGTLIAMTRLFDLGLPQDAPGASAVLALGLIMGVLSIGTSPSITLAVLSETRAKGRLADLVLGAAVFKDLVVVVCLAIAIAIARGLLLPGSELDGSVLVAVGIEIGGSLLAGALLGALMIAYMRFVKAEMLLFVAAMILVVAELCRVLHLELLLVFIAAGFFVRNLSKYEHELMKPLELVALPVFVVFFTNAGAGIELQSTWKILPVAFALCSVRALVYYWASRFGNFVGKEAPGVGKHVWYAYLPQAGVTLGLVGLAAQQLPVIGNSIATTGMAVVAINLLVGPVLLRKALSAAHEIPDAAHEAARADVSPVATSSSIEQAHAPQTAAHRLRLERDPDLAASFLDLRARAVAILDEFGVTTLGSLPLLPRTDTAPPPEYFDQFVTAHRRACRALFDQMLACLAGLPSLVKAGLDPDSLQPRVGDRWTLRLRLSMWRLGYRRLARARQRRVFVRLAARLTLERGFAELAYAVFERSIFSHLSEFERRATGKPANDSDGQWLRQQLVAKLDAHFDAFADLLLSMGTPRCRPSQLRFSNVEPAIRVAVGALDAGQEDFWAQRAQAVWGAALAQRHTRELESEACKALDQHVLSPARHAEQGLGPAILRLERDLKALKPPAGDTGSSASADASGAWREQLEALRHSALDELSRELRASTALRALTNQLRQTLATVPSQVRCLQLKPGQSPAEGAIGRVELRALAERYWLKGLLPTVDQATRAISNAFAQLPRRVKEALEPSWTSLEALAEQGSRTDFASRVDAELSIALHRLSLTEQRVRREVELNLQSIALAVEHARKALPEHVQLQSVNTATRRRLLAPLLERADTRLKSVRDWLALHGPKTAPLRDATDLRRAVERWQGDPLPDNVARWFDQAPVRDERIFTAQRELLEAIVDEEAQWLAGRVGSILLRGPVGSGKSTLLNMCELELHSSRVLRLDGEGSEQAATLQQAIATALNCAVDDAPLRRQLDVQHPAILVDNLDVWLGRGTDKATELGRLLSLITQTRGTAFWLVAVDSATIDVLEEVSDVLEVFTRVMDCRPLSVGELAGLLDARRRRASVELTFTRTLRGEFARRLGLGSERELFLSTLARVSEGNPGRALAECARSASMRQNVLSLDSTRLRLGWTRIAQSLSTTQVAILATILRLGSSDLPRVEDELGLATEHLERHLAFLLGAGLLSRGQEGHAFSVPDAARWPVVLELRRLGALGAIKG